MLYNEAVDFVHGLTRFGSQLGLERIKKLLALLGNPQDRLKFIHVAGTNGKGSVTNMCSSILTYAGYRVGMYTSPFVIDFRERFQINGVMIEEEEFAKLCERIKELTDQMATEGDQITEFEFITALAFEYFHLNDCDIVCLEVGLGGKYDATNVISSPLAAVITSISMDHVEILGDTIEKIAGEKAGIIKDNTDVFVYPLQNPDALAVIMEKCSEMNATIYQIPRINVASYEKTKIGTFFQFDDEEFFVPLLGDHQVFNAVMVIDIMRNMTKKGFKICEEDIEKGLEKTFVPARFEILRKRPLFVLDGAHNAQAMDELCKTLKMFRDKPKIAIVGMMADKDIDHALRKLSECCDTIITVPVKENSRSISSEELYERARHTFKAAYCCHDYKEALDLALSLRVERSDAVIACGSFYMASGMRQVFLEHINSIRRNIKGSSRYSK